MQNRHGDVQIIKVDKLPEDAKLIVGRKELAYGEVTGHAHRIDIGELFETKNGELYLRVSEMTETRVRHEEHKTIPIAPGIHRIGIKRQYTPEGWETVRD